MPWTYANALPGGGYDPVGGGTLDPGTGHWTQGAYNTDDITRTAVVYLRHYEQTGDDTSLATAYELLRAVAYMQTLTGPNAGNFVLWMQPDGTLNPSAQPPEPPDPSDSGPSYWLARSLWALGEGYATFVDEDPEFADFLAGRMGLAREAVDRQVLDTYGEFAVADGLTVPTWLIVDEAGATAEAVLGLSAYLEANPSDDAARETNRKLAEGIAAMGTTETRDWPFGAIRPWALSPAVWHAWASQMPAALARAATVLDDPRLLEPAITDSVSFTPLLLTSGGADNAWQPSPTDRTQIAYGADSRLQSLFDVAEAADLPALEDLAAVQASWYFGANAAGEPMYVQETGVTFDGLSAEGAVNRNAGAESTIHGLLSMIALDAHPEASARARATTRIVRAEGLSMVEAEDATSTTGTISTPADPWTGESQYSGDVLTLDQGETAQWTIPASDSPRVILPVSWRAEGQTSASSWSAGPLPMGTVDHSGLPQGISPVPGALLPSALDLPAASSTVHATATSGSVVLDTLLLRPTVARLVLGGDRTTELVQVSTDLPQLVTVGTLGLTAHVTVHDALGLVRDTVEVLDAGTVLVPPGGFAVVTY